MPDGTLQVLEGDYKNARDSQGRQYSDVTSAGIVDRKLTSETSVSIYDPVCGLLIDWNTRAKVATVTHLLPSKPVQARWRPEYPNGPRTEVRDGVETRIEPLGTKRILGLQVLGIRWLSVIDAGSSSENKGQVHVMAERWDSLDLEILLESVFDDPRTSAGRTHAQIVRLDRSEPDPQLFRIPERYVIRDRWAPASEYGPEVAPGWKLDPPPEHGGQKEPPH